MFYLLVALWLTTGIAWYFGLTKKLERTSVINEIVSACLIGLTTALFIYTVLLLYTQLQI